MLLSSRKKETAAPSICRESVECSDSKDESFSPDSDANDSDVELLTAESGSSDAGQEEDIVSCCGNFDENEGVQENYVYSERSSGKGSDQINTMLDQCISKIIESGTKRLMVYAENCSGQNKNNYMIKFLLA
ncbi:hypothetical protein PC110_g22060 [Phytophthora cactorum]|uniref:Uncharacterized protein n=2 Tax=Phytophthora cactorum TaxID=29920 RepID=A0A329R9X9_9STRA|nr:hypothetical protein PC110_g22060 [Phytophthora cactorum]